MRYIIEHTRLGFCWWDLLALIILLAVIIVWIAKHRDLKKEQNDYEDQLSDLYAGDSVEANKQAATVTAEAAEK